MTLPAAAARAPAAIGRYLLPAPKLRQVADVDRRDRQTNGQPTDTVPYIMRAASKDELETRPIAYMYPYI